MPAIRSSLSDRVSMNVLGLAAMLGLHVGLLSGAPLLGAQVFVCRSGSAADTQAISSFVELYISQHQMELGGPVDVQTVANLSMQLLYNNKVRHLQEFCGV